MRQATRFLVIALGAVTAMCAQAAASSDAGPTVELHKLGDFNAPVDVAQPRGSRGLVFVAENAGTIAVLRNGRELSHDFLDITDLVDCGCGEVGLKSIAFDPGYSHNRRFYVLYTNKDGDSEVDSFQRSRGSEVFAHATSRHQVIVIPEVPPDPRLGGRRERLQRREHAVRDHAVDGELKVVHVAGHLGEVLAAQVARRPTVAMRSQTTTRWLGSRDSTRSSPGGYAIRGASPSTGTGLRSATSANRTRRRSITRLSMQPTEPTSAGLSTREPCLTIHPVPAKENPWLQSSPIRTLWAAP